MKNLLPFIVSLMLGQTLLAQTEAPINTDRPDQSDGTYILTRKKFQLENGLLFSEGSLVNNFMLRYGLTNSTEIRLLADVGKVEDAKGLMPLGLSVKQRITEQKSLLPAITLVGYARYGKIASSDFKNDEWSYSLLLAFQNDITDQLSIGYNLGTTTLFDDLNFTVSVGYAPFEKISFFGEYFSHFEDPYQPSHNADAGILYLINNRLQLDIAAGAAIFAAENAPFLTAGISWRIN